MLRTTLIAVAVLGLAACASDGASSANSGRECFSSSSVNGYNVVDDHTIRVNVGASRRYLLTTAWNTRDLNWTQAVALHSPTGQICTGNGVGYELRGGDPVRPYLLTGIARQPDDVPAGS